jgi:predicted ester cyclase
MKYANAILLSFMCLPIFNASCLAEAPLPVLAPSEQRAIEERNVRNFTRWQVEKIPVDDYSGIEQFMAPEVKVSPGGGGADGLMSLLGKPLLGEPVTPSSRTVRVKGFAEGPGVGFAGVKNHRRTMEEIYGIGDTVVARWRIQGDVTGSLLGVPGHGRPIDIMEVAFVQFDREGRMVKAWMSIDGAALLHQLGVTVDNLQQNGAPLNSAK